MTFGLQACQDFLGVARAAGFDAVAVQHFQRVENRGSVLGECAARQGLEGVADELFAVGFRHQHGEGGVLRRGFGELRVQCQTGDDVDYVAEVDALIRAESRLVTHGDALCPILQGLGFSLVGDIEGGHLLFL